MFTITSQDRHGVIIKETTNDTQSQVQGENSGYRIRRLTPRECFFLQGFSNESFEKAQGAGISDSQLYKMAGNAVTVNVTYEIAKTIAESEIYINMEDEVSNGI